MDFTVQDKIMDNESFLELENNPNVRIYDYLMFFVVNISTQVVLMYATNPPEKGIEVLDKIVADEYKKNIMFAIADQNSSHYRFLKHIEPECKPLCLLNLINLTVVLIKDTMQNTGVEEVLGLKKQEIFDDINTYFSLIKYVAIDFIKYFFMANNSTVICSKDCRGKTIDQLIEQSKNEIK